MEEEKSSKEFLDEVEKEGEEPPTEDQQEKETPAESSTEDKPTEESPSSQGEEDSKKEEVEAPKEESSTEMEEKPLPFHEHPRWKQMYDENQTLKKDIETIKDDVGKDKLQREEQVQSQTIPNWFSSQFGDDPKSWQEFQARESARDERLIKRIQSDQQEVVQRQQQDADKWTNWVRTEIQGLKDEGLKFNENELKKTIADYKPTDEQGNLDFHKGYEIMTKLKSVEVAKKAVKTQEKKEVAAQTMDEGSKGEPEKQEFMTSKDLKNMGWNDFNN